MEEEARITNQVNGPVLGKVVQVGHADSITYVGAAPARSRYLEWVRQIAPAELIGRERELAELAHFCTAEDGPDYVWFRAEPWTGKSALMASFVLAPPAGVRIVSFFVTARSAEDDTQEGFVDAVQEQLAAILGTAKDPAARNVPAVFHETAAHCDARGERLVLVVDGLDEDRTAGGHSIASLLPFPSHGLRVIVASRLNPGVPADVRPDHPLHAPGIERSIATSAAAQVMQADMKRELDVLLERERDLLGLLVAARGGLTRSDFAELGKRPVREIEKALNSVASRSFSRRPAHWRSTESAEIFVLGHENLQREAEESLSAEELDRYRSELDAWAHQYRDAGWPPKTPQFLLRGYFRLVQETGNAVALADLAADSARHARLLAVSGNDLAALAELDRARTALLEDGGSELLRLITVDFHREDLHDRNLRTPKWLPAIWAEAGSPGPAVALVRAMTDPTLRDGALIELVGALARTGRTELARQLAEDGLSSAQLDKDELDVAIPVALARAGKAAEAAAAATQAGGRLSADLRNQVDAYVALAEGEPDRAERLAREIVDERLRDRTMSGLGRMLLAVRNLDAAERFHALIDSNRQLSEPLLSELIETYYWHGPRSRAEELAERFGQRALTANLERAARLRASDDPLEEEFAASGESGSESERNKRLLDVVDALIAEKGLGGVPVVLGAMTRSSPRTEATARYVRALAEHGKAQEAFFWAEALEPDAEAQPYHKTLHILGELAQGALRAGDHVSARKAAKLAAELARRPVPGKRLLTGLRVLVGAVVATGDIRRAEVLVPLVLLARLEGPELVGFLDLVAAEGDCTVAKQLIVGLGRASTVRAQFLVLADRFREAEDRDALGELAAKVQNWIDSYRQRADQDLSACVAMMCAAGQYDQISRTFVWCRQEKEPVLTEILDGVAQLAKRGEDVLALQLCELVPEDQREDALATAVKVLAMGRWVDLAERIADRPDKYSMHDHRSTFQAFLLGVVTHDLPRALAKAELIRKPADRAAVLVELAKHAEPAERRRILARAVALDHWSVVVPALGIEDLAGVVAMADRFGAPEA